MPVAPLVLPASPPPRRRLSRRAECACSVLVCGIALANLGLQLVTLERWTAFGAVILMARSTALALLLAGLALALRQFFSEHRIARHLATALTAVVAAAALHVIAGWTLNRMPPWEVWLIP